MKYRLKIAITVSLIAHLAIIGGIIWLNGLSPEKAYGEREYIISVDMISDSKTAELTHKPQDTKDEIRDTRYEIRTTRPTKHTEQSKGPTATQTPITTGDGGANKVLATIKARIESVKRYPRLARRMKIEGRPTVLFEINNDGSLKYVKITNSSGEKIIDDAAIETVKKAAPLPYYGSPIKLAIRYELK